MTVHNISFSPEHSLEAILYISGKVAEATIHEILKIIYFSDKLHLSKYGFLASGDEYVAMDFGPVASNTYNLIKAARGEQSSYINPLFYRIVDGSFEIAEDKRTIIAHRDPRIEYLSAAETECFNDAIRQYGGLSFKERTELSHDRAWEIARKSGGDGVGASPMPVSDIANTLDNAIEVITYISA